MCLDAQELRYHMSNYPLSIRVIKAWPAGYGSMSELLWSVVDLAAVALA